MSDMTKKEIIAKILSASQGQSSNLFGVGGGAGWMGQVSGVQQQVSSELAKWESTADDDILRGLIGLPVTVSALSENEADELLRSLSTSS